MDNRAVVALLALGALAFLMLRSRSAQAAALPTYSASYGYTPTQPSYTYTPQPTSQPQWYDYVDDVWNIWNDATDIFDWPTGTETPSYPTYTPPPEQPTPQVQDEWGSIWDGYDYDPGPSGAVDIWDFPYDPYTPPVEPTPAPQPTQPSYSFSVDVPEPYRAAILDAASQYGVPHDTLARLLYRESAFRDDIVYCRLLSATGAMGIAQFMPATAQDVARAVGAFDPCDPIPSIYAAAYYLVWLYRQTGNWLDAVAAYNWGVGNVRNFVAGGRSGSVPQETNDYTAFIMGTAYGSVAYAGTTTTIGIRG